MSDKICMLHFQQILGHDPPVLQVVPLDQWPLPTTLMVLVDRSVRLLTDMRVQYAYSALHIPQRDLPLLSLSRSVGLAEEGTDDLQLCLHILPAVRGHCVQLYVDHKETLVRHYDQ